MQTISYMAERVVGHGSFGVVFQVSFISLSPLCSVVYDHFSISRLSLIPLFFTFLDDSGEMSRDRRNCCNKESSTRSEVQEP